MTEYIINTLVFLFLVAPMGAILPVLTGNPFFYFLKKREDPFFCNLNHKKKVVGKRPNNFSDYLITKIANSNLIVVLGYRNMLLLIAEVSLVSNKNYGRGTQN